MPTFLAPLDMSGLEIQNVLAQNLGSDPASPAVGQFWFNTAADVFRVRSAAGTVSMASDAAVVHNTLFDANTLLKADSDDTPLALAVAASTFVGRRSTGGIAAMTPTQAKTELAIASSDVSGLGPFATAANGAAGWAILSGTAGAAVDLNGQRLTNGATPTAAADLVTKAYADALASGLDFKSSARLATAAALPAYSRVANVITATSNGALTVDGVAVAVTNRILVKDGAAGADNGLYDVTATGGAGAPFVLTRSADADSSAEVTSGMYVFVSEGTANSGRGYVLSTADPITLNTTALTFVLFIGAGTVIGTTDRITVVGNTVDIAPTYVGQTSITTTGTLTAGTLGAGFTTVAVARGGTGATDAAGARTSLGFTARYEADIGDGSTTAIAVTHSLGKAYPSAVEVWDVATKAKQDANVVATNSNTVTITFAVAPATNSKHVVVTA